jgi:hypothetical protein
VTVDNNLRARILVGALTIALESWDHGDAIRTRDPIGKAAMFGFRQFCECRRGLCLGAPRSRQRR